MCARRGGGFAVQYGAAVDRKTGLTQQLLMDVYTVPGNRTAKAPVTSHACPAVLSDIHLHSLAEMTNCVGSLYSPSLWLRMLSCWFRTEEMTQPCLICPHAVSLATYADPALKR